MKTNIHPLGLAVAFVCPLLLGALNTPLLANDLKSSPPVRPKVVRAPSSGQTIDNGDGTFTWRQVVNQSSTAPHYVPPTHGGGFGIYSWFNQDYGWQHSFAPAATPGINIVSATLTIQAWDIDSEVSHGYGGEYDGLSGDGEWLNPQYLQGNNATWSVTVMNVNPSALVDGLLNVWLNIDMHHTSQTWATTLNYSQLDVVYSYGGTNRAPSQPEFRILPVGCTNPDDDLVVEITGPTPPDPDGDAVTYEYRWLVDSGTGFFVDDEFAGRGNHTGNTVPAADTRNGDRWKAEITAIDEHGLRGTAAAAVFAQIGGCNTPPVARAGLDSTIVGMTTVLDGSASFDEGSITGYEWEIYDGTGWVMIGTDPVITYTFGGPGTHQIRLTVTDNLGAVGSALVYITTGMVAPPIIGATPASNRGYFALAASSTAFPPSSLGIYIKDTNSAFVAGPFPSGVVVRLRKSTTTGIAAGFGPASVTVNVRGNGNAVAVDPDGRESAPVMLRSASFVR